jgi:hypothetical protein
MGPGTLVVSPRARLPKMAKPHTWFGILPVFITRLYKWRAH